MVKYLFKVPRYPAVDAESRDLKERLALEKLMTNIAKMAKPLGKRFKCVEILADSEYIRIEASNNG